MKEFLILLLSRTQRTWRLSFRVPPSPLLLLSTILSTMVFSTSVVARSTVTARMALALLETAACHATDATHVTTPHLVALLHRPCYRILNCRLIWEIVFSTIRHATGLHTILHPFDVLPYHLVLGLEIVELAIATRELLLVRTDRCSSLASTCR